MSEEMAIGESASGKETKLNGDGAAAASVAEPERASSEHQGDPSPPQTEEATPTSTDVQQKSAPTVQPDKIKDTDRGAKRRASIAFSKTTEAFRGFDKEQPKEEEFKGFEQADQEDLSNYNRILERLESEVSEARKSFTPLRTVVANLAIRAGKRARQDTDGSRPSSGLSSRSDGDGGSLIEGASAASSPANRRRVTIEISSPLLRVPLERGWKRELVYRAALDAHSRRNADIYYYTPKGKKLRSTREVAEHLAGTGLTLENFSFFKEPLGVDDPDKEIIRDAKMMRRVDSPVSSPAPVVIEGKRTPKPKPPKGASPERSTPKSPPAKIKVKSMGSRLSSSASSPSPSPAQNTKQKKPLQTATNENNNTAAWKKPRQPHPPAGPAPGPPAQGPAQPAGASVSEATPPPVPPPPPPPLQSRPQHPPMEDKPMCHTAQRQCSLTCGRGVPTLACDACLCLYHPACLGVPLGHDTRPFLCKNCDDSGSPPTEPPPLVHKSGVTSVIPQPRRVPAQHPPMPPLPQQSKNRADQRVLLRMKVSGGGPDGERVWAVAKPPPTPTTVPSPSLTPTPTPPPKPPAPAPPRGQANLPQSIAVLNGRRFIVVPRNLIQSTQQK